MSREKEKILVVLVAGIGDLIMGSPALRCIRNGHPDAEIHLLTNIQAVPLAMNYGFIDRVWPFPIRDILRDRKGLIEGLKLVAQLRKEGFDTCVNLFRIHSTSGSVRMGMLFMAIGAKERIGHDSKGFGFFLTKKAPENNFGNGHVAESMLEIAVLAGGLRDDKGIEVFWNKESELKWKNSFSDDHNGPVVGINPGGDRKTKRWPVERYASLAVQLVKQYHAKIIVLGGPGEEESADSICKSLPGASFINLAGRLTLSDLAYISSQLDLLITNDSGPMHIAAAAGAPIVCIFGPDDPGRTGPYVPEKRYAIVRTSLDCQPCFSANCAHVSCMTGISVNMVFDVVHGLLLKYK